MLTDQECLDQAKADITGAWSNLKDWRDRTRTCYKFDAGDQWDKENKDRLTALKRACFTFNRIRPMINTVVGMEIGNRHEIKTSPRNMPDNGSASVFDALLRWAREVGEIPDEETDAWRDLLIAGMGWTNTTMDYADNPDGQIAVTRVSPLEMLWSTRARRKNLKDASFVCRLCKWPKRDFERKWPGVQGYGHVFGIDGEDISKADEPHANDPRKRYKVTPEGGESTADLVEYMVAEYQYCEYDDLYTVANPMAPGVVERYPAEKFQKIRKALEAQGARFYERGQESKPKPGKNGQPAIPFVRTEVRHVYRAFFTGDEMIEGTHTTNPFPAGFTYQVMTGSRDEDTGNFDGIVFGAEESQKLLNKIISAMVDIFNYGPKGGIIAEEDAFTNKEEAQQNAARWDRILFVRKGYADRIIKRDPVELPASADKIVQLAIDGLPSTTGINWESLGTVNRDQSGLLEQTRKQSTLTALSSFFDSLKRYRQGQSRVMMYFFQTMFTPQVLARIVGEQLAPMVPTIMNVDVVQYDIEVGEAPNSPNQREAVLSVFKDLTQYSEQLAMLLAPSLIPYLPLPKPLLDDMQQRASQAGQKTPEQQFADLLQAKLAMAKIQSLLGDAAANYAKADAAGAGVALKEMKIQFDFIDSMLNNLSQKAENAKDRTHDLVTTAIDAIGKTAGKGKASGSAGASGQPADRVGGAPAQVDVNVPAGGPNPYGGNGPTGLGS